MAHPKRKTSKARKRKRRSHHALAVLQLVTCPQCDKPKRNHAICNACGHYGKDRPVIVKEES